MAIRDSKPVRSEAAHSTAAVGGAVATPQVAVVNPVIGLGQPTEDFTDQTFLESTHQDVGSLQTALRESDIIQKAVSIIVSDALAQSITFPNLEPDQLQALTARLRELRFFQILRELPILARTYGDAYAYLDLTYQRNPSARRPLNYQPGSLRQLTLFNGFEVVPDNRTVNRSPGVSLQGIPYSGLPQRYLHLQPQPEPPIEIHPSRLIRLTHQRPPPGGWLNTETVQDGRLIGLNRSYCGLSVTHTILNLVATELEGIGAVRKLTSQASVLDLAMENFYDLERNNQTQETVRKVAQAASVWKIFAHPQDSTMSRLAVNFAGLKDVLSNNVDRIGIALDIPKTRWSGEDPGGLHGAASAEASIRRYSTMVASYQRDHLNPFVETVLSYVAADLDFQDGIDFAWPSYIPQSSKEKAETTLLQTQALEATLTHLQNSVTAGYLTEEEAKEEYTMAREQLRV